MQCLCKDQIVSEIRNDSYHPIMPKIAPIKRKDLIYYLRQLGFEKPNSGGNHQYMQKSGLKVRIPNPHKSDIGKNLLIDILKQANVDKTTWEEL